MGDRGRSSRRGARAIASAIAVLVASAGAVGQGPAAQPGVDPLSLTGRDFGGVRIPGVVTAGPIELAAQRAWAWVEAPPSTPGGRAIAPTRRVVLEGDVELRLGAYEFRAMRAAVWMQAVEGGAYQVFAVMEEVGRGKSRAGIALSATRLRVQGVLRPTGEISLRADRLEPRAVSPPWVLEAELDFGRFLRRVLVGDRFDSPPSLEVAQQERDERVAAVEQALREMADRTLTEGGGGSPIFAPDGVITVAAGHVSGALGGAEEEGVVVLTGGVHVQYWRPGPGDTVRARGSSGHRLHLSAQRAVLFLAPGAPRGATTMPVSHIRGIYLEGDVIATQVEHRADRTQHQFSISAPHVYYSVEHDRAIMVDAVFRTYEHSLQQPLYVRARTIEQQAQRQFRAREATLTNSAFFDPDLSLGVSSVTIAAVPRLDGPGGYSIDVDAEDLRVDLAGIPIFYWPRFRGDPAEIPLRDLRVENGRGSGVAIKTAWDLYTLVGARRPPGTQTELLVDYYLDRGPAVGAEAAWSREFGDGELFAYLVPHDTGRDQLSSGARRGREGEFRGMISAEHRAEVSEHWTVFGEVAHISDENFIDAFFDPLSKLRRPYDTGLYAQRIEANTVATAELRTRLNDFIVSEQQLQTPGFTTARLPEVGYHRVADDVLAETSPGLLTYTSDSRLGQLRLDFVEPTADELGFTTLARARSFWGIPPHGTIADALRAQGYSERPVTRFDTRHELAMALEAGPVRITPFVVGRFTAYDDDFAEFSPDADEPWRFWGALGTTVSTEVQRVDNNVESRLLDIHRLRHIVAPSATIWTAGSTIDGGELPVYDDNVEGISDGSAVRLSVEQTWQTQRGGAGRWRSVDVFTLDTELVFSSTAADVDSPIGRWFDFRPEQSNMGDFATFDSGWQVSDATALGFNMIYDLDGRQPERTIVGGTIDHNPDFSTFAELRYINSQDQTYVSAGISYALTPKYDVNAFATYDTDAGEVQGLTLALDRRLPNASIGVAVQHNNITDETHFGFRIQPLGLGARGRESRVRGVGGGAPGGTRVLVAP